MIDLEAWRPGKSVHYSHYTLQGGYTLSSIENEGFLTFTVRIGESKATQNAKELTRLFKEVLEIALTE